MDRAGAVVDHPEVGDEIAPEQLDRPFLERRAGREVVEFPPVRAEREADIRMGERVQGEDGADVRLFGLVGAEELAADRHVEEEVADFDVRPGRRADVAHLLQFAARDRQLDPRLVLRTPRLDQHPRDGGDGGDGLAPEAEGVDPLDVLDVGNLARRLPFQTEQRVVAVHAAAVVPHADQLAPAGGDGDVNPFRAGVDRVFDQFLDDGGGTLDDLPRRDFVRDVERQQFDVSVFRHAVLS